MQDLHPDPQPAGRDLQASLREARAAVAARDEFLAIAAHELRSPLHALGLRLQVLERMAAGCGDPQLEREIARTRQSVDRYVKRAVVLLDVSRLGSSELRLTLGKVRLADLVKEVVHDHLDEARFRGASLQERLLADPVGEWDAHMVEQIVANLVSNAIKYGNGSPVLVCVSQPEPGWACLQVSDGGPGIAEAQRARIFEKFERLVSGSRQHAGFGLGLWIVGRMVAAHGGTIEVAARAGGGSVFRVRLPLAVPSSKTKEGSS